MRYNKAIIALFLSFGFFAIAFIAFSQMVQTGFWDSVILYTKLLGIITVFMLLKHLGECNWEQFLQEVMTTFAIAFQDTVTRGYDYGRSVYDWLAGTV